MRGLNIESCHGEDMDSVLHIAETALRVSMGIIGALFVYTAFFVYRDEKQRIMNKIEEWWKTIVSPNETLIQRQTAFLVAATKLAKDGLDSIMGERIISLRSITVSASLSMCSLALCVLVSFKVDSDWARPIFGGASLLYALEGLYLSPRFSKSKFVQILLITSMPLVIVAVMAAFDATRPLPPPYPNEFHAEIPLFMVDAVLIAICLIIVSGGIAVDVMVVAALRKLLSRLASASNLVEIVTCFALNLLIVGMLCGGFLFFYKVYYVDQTEGSFPLGLLAPIFASNAFSFMVSASVLCIVIVAIAHKIMWPLIGRLVYPIVDNRLLENKRVLAVSGGMMIGCSFQNLKPIIEWLISHY